MLKKLLEKLLVKFGKTYKIDNSIPSGLILSILLSRFFMIIRGFFKTGRKIFVGKNTKILNSKNFEFGHGCTLDKYVTLDCYAKEKVIFGNSVKIGAYSTVSVTSHLSKYGKGLSIGDNSSIGEYSYFGSSGGICIGNDVIMGQYISFHSENHNYKDKDKLIREQGVVSEGIIIGNNIWVGAKVTFLDGCVVDNNSVVAAGSVVKDKFPPDVIIGGVPAKILKNI